ncbi:sensor histidine kinase [Thalassococcus sp. S3]|uniref:sensor histidine kinase n=1 Tax=Thalassococcus sp. S3 TaxID=2017482 RepID=UPI001024843A|nr:histidine kinase dimerization/phosphoacceptor domain -containing protein [Thalassococcus sp. S3]QBF29954.1 hypothetical protein CFI11_01795 [Thalassococcus sp. S3]
MITIPTARKRKGLVFRVTVFLSVALAPIGIIAVLQTLEVMHQTARSSELSVLTLTRDAASREQLSLERAFGAAEALGAVALSLRRDGERCDSYLRQFIEANPKYSFVGLLPRDGIMTCSSTEQEYDFTTFDRFDEIMETPRPVVEANFNAPLSGTSVVIVSQPVFEEDSFVGYLTLSIPHDWIDPTADLTRLEKPIGLLTFNAFGQILTAERGVDTAMRQLPPDLDLTRFVGSTSDVFVAEDSNGQERVYTVVSIIPETVYALGTWTSDQGIASRVRPAVWSVPFPILMWIASVLVAVYALDRLVIRHVKSLRGQMVSFARNRTLPSPLKGSSVPSELSEMRDTFAAMANRVILEDADRENVMREMEGLIKTQNELLNQKDALVHQKSILLKEVHHRVKNNLQLISSIMNMQQRTATHSETRQIVGRLQDRVLGLAKIHQRLYQTERIDKIDAGAMIQDLIGQMSRLGSESIVPQNINVSAETIQLFPDQAVPFSLLVSELMTNALKYARAPEGQAPTIDVSLIEEEDDTVELKIANSISDERAPPSGTGLGNRLVQAFVNQLDGEIIVEEASDEYRVIVTFTRSEFVPEERDY